MRIIFGLAVSVYLFFPSVTLAQVYDPVHISVLGKYGPSLEGNGARFGNKDGCVTITSYHVVGPNTTARLSPQKKGLSFEKFDGLPSLDVALIFENGRPISPCPEYPSDEVVRDVLYSSTNATMVYKDNVGREKYIQLIKKDQENSEVLLLSAKDSSARFHPGMSGAIILMNDQPVAITKSIKTDGSKIIEAVRLDAIRSRFRAIFFDSVDTLAQTGEKKINPLQPTPLLDIEKISLRNELLEDGLIEKSVKLDNNFASNLNKIAKILDKSSRNIGPAEKKDRAKAGKLFEASCRFQDFWGCLNLGIGQVYGLTEYSLSASGADLIKYTCDMDYGPGCTILGKLYYDGKLKGGKNLEEAVQLYDFACRRGAVDACYYLASMHMNEEAGLAKDPNFFEGLLDKVCRDEGSAFSGDACHYQAHVFFGEYGDEFRNEVKANIIIKRAFERNNAGAYYHMGSKYVRSGKTGYQKKQGWELIGKSCEFDNYDACYWAGLHYFEPANQDLDKVERYLSKSCEVASVQLRLFDVHMHDHDDLAHSREKRLMENIFTGCLGYLVDLPSVKFKNDKKRYQETVELNQKKLKSILELGCELDLKTTNGASPCDLLNQNTIMK